MQRPDTSAEARPDLRIVDARPQAAGGESRADPETQMGIGGLHLGFGIKNTSKTGTYELTAERDRERRSERAPRQQVGREERAYGQLAM